MKISVKYLMLVMLTSLIAWLIYSDVLGYLDKMVDLNAVNIILLGGFALPLVTFYLVNTLKNRNKGYSYLQGPEETQMYLVSFSGNAIRKEDHEGLSILAQRPFRSQPLIDEISGQAVSVTRDATGNLPQKGYSLKQFAAFAAGDPESLRQILDSFIRSGKQNVKLFRKYLQERNNEAVSELSHKMLTLFRQMEAFAIVDILVLLEQKDFAVTGSRNYFSLGKAALEMIEALLQTIQEDEKVIACYSEKTL